MAKFDPNNAEGMSRSDWKKFGPGENTFETRRPDPTPAQIQDKVITANKKKKTQGAGSLDAGGGGKVKAPRPMTEPQPPPRQPTPEEKATGVRKKPKPTRGVNQPAPAEQILAPRTFAQAGTKEFGQRGFQGAIFSPESRFAMNPGMGGNAMAKGQPFISRLLQQTMAAGQPQGGATLMAASPATGGLPADGGLVGGAGGGEEDLQQILAQMMMVQ